MVVNNRGAIRWEQAKEPYQQECWDCLVSSGDIMAGCQMQQGGLGASFLLVASGHKARPWTSDTHSNSYLIQAEKTERQATEREAMKRGGEAAVEKSEVVRPFPVARETNASFKEKNTANEKHRQLCWERIT
ncbi:unnamed protein product [Tetraodon nigroviridis]|uniref:(spotted green pufferfish) hypothetical protein n=1 Tax=Tetraodon nigroviridis TaxID=99883 RepID=Q4SAE2_TETNG|nr:unnamed protein product [Tetraodon nigroviridis]